MEDPVKNIFKLNLMVMRLMGFYSPKKFKQLYKLYAYAVYMCCTIPVPVLAAVHLIIGENVDLVEVGDSLFIVVQMGSFIIKFAPFIFNVEEVGKSLNMMEWPVFNNYTLEQRVIIEDCYKVCKRITLMFLGLSVTAFITWATTPFFESSHKFPVKIWLPFESASDTKRYFCIFIFIFVGGSNDTLSSSAIDPLVSGMACFAAAQLKILKNNLEHLSDHAEQQLDIILKSNIETCERHCLKNELIYEKIKACIVHHNAVLKFVEHYENVYSIVAFTQFMAAVIVICGSCLQLSMVEPFTYTFFAMICFLATMLSQIFLYCYFGTSLFEESNSLTTAIYMGTWYEFDVKSKNALLVLMERSKKPVTVTAGKILDLSLVTFMTILRKAYSLLAVLKNYEGSM